MIKSTQKKSAVTQKRLHKVALELMTTKGFRQTKVKDICEKANVSIGTFYSYFSSKKDIIKEICLTGDNLFLSTVADEIAGKSFAEQIKIYIHYFAQFNSEMGPDVLGLLYTPNNDQFLQMRPMQVVLQNIILNGKDEGLIRSDLTVENTTKQIFTVLRGVCFDWCVNNGAFSMERRMYRYIQLALEGLYQRENNHLTELQKAGMK